MGPTLAELPNLFPLSYSTFYKHSVIACELLMQLSALNFLIFVIPCPPHVSVFVFLFFWQQQHVHVHPGTVWKSDIKQHTSFLFNISCLGVAPQYSSKGLSAPSVNLYTMLVFMMAFSYSSSSSSGPHAMQEKQHMCTNKKCKLLV